MSFPLDRQTATAATRTGPVDIPAMPSNVPSVYIIAMLSAPKHKRALTPVLIIVVGVFGCADTNGLGVQVDRDAGLEQPVDASAPDARADTDSGTASPDGGLDPTRDGGRAPPSDAGFVDAGAPGGGCGLDPGTNDRLRTLQHDGRAREFYVHFPDGFDNRVPTPVVFDFHGRLLTASNQMLLSRMRSVGDRRGFIVVHPEGIDRTWNGGVCCGEAATQDVDDVGFVSAMIDHLLETTCIDERRVFATGMSNGGFLAHRLGCELADRIAAIAPVAGVVGVTNCSPNRAVPVFHFHGTADRVVWYDGFAGFLSVADSIDGWVERNDCGTLPSVFFEQDDVRCEAWTGCRDGADVRLCTVEDGGHTWPGGTPAPPLGRTTNTISASEMAWDFFAAHPMPE